MISEWLATYLIHSTILLAGAWVGVRFKALQAPWMQSTVWKTALVAGIITASLQTLTPLGAVNDIRGWVTTPTEAAAIAAPAQRTSPDPAVAPGPQPVIAPADRAGAAAARPDAAEPQPLPLLVLLYIGGAAILFSRLLLHAISLRRVIRRATGDIEPAIQAEFDALKWEALVPHARLRQTSDIQQPVATAGGLVCVPTTLLATLKPGPRRAMLAHELAHVAHHDPAWLWITRCIEAALFVQPLNFIASRRIADPSELLADARATTIGAAPRQLAECLRQVARRQLSTPLALASGMAHDRQTLISRIERLLEESTMHNETLPSLRRGAAFVLPTILLAVLLLPGATTGADWFGQSRSGTSVEVHGDDDYTRIKVSHRSDDLRMKLDASGRFAFNDAETDFTTLDGEFDLQVEQDGVKERFVFEGNGDQFTRRYWRNRDESTDSVLAQERFAAWLPVVFRTTGIDAEARVHRLLKRDGPDAVLAEVRLIDSDLVARRYLTTLSGAASLNEAELSTAIALAESGIGSDLEHRLTLTALIEHQDLSQENWEQLVESTQEIGSDLEQRLVLTSAAESMSGSPALLRLYAAAVGEIGSDLEARLALKALSRHDLDADAMREVLRASEAIGSDLEQRLTLQAFADQAVRQGVALDYIRAAEEIGSDLEARLALQALLEAGVSAADAVALVDAAAASIGSDLELRLVLEDVLDQHAADGAVRSAVLAATEELGRAERERITDRLLM